MIYDIETYTNQGPREDNQDRFIIDKTKPDYAIVAIADGVGGNKKGDIAAENAVGFFLELIHNSKSRSMKDIFIQINDKIVKLGNEQTDFKGMLTTLSGCVIGSNKIWFGHVGDSRIYIINKSTISRITEDHSEVNRLLREGKITKEDIDFYPRKNVLTDAIGMERIPQIQSGSYPLKNNDCILLTTDGIHGVLSDIEIHQLYIKSISLSDFKEKIKKALKLKIITDNNTLVCVQVFSQN